jgi:hypothetical protein
MVTPSRGIALHLFVWASRRSLDADQFFWARRLDGVSDKNVENNPMQSRSGRSGVHFGDTEKRLTRRAKQGHYVMVAGARRRRDS